MDETHPPPSPRAGRREGAAIPIAAAVMFLFLASLGLDLVSSSIALLFSMNAVATAASRATRWLGLALVVFSGWLLALAWMAG